MLTGIVPFASGLLVVAAGAFHLTAVLLVPGVMDLYAKAGVTAAITAERLGSGR